MLMFYSIKKQQFIKFNAYNKQIMRETDHKRMKATYSARFGFAEKKPNTLNEMYVECKIILNCILQQI